MPDIAAACRIFMNEFWRIQSEGEQPLKSGFVLGGIDIAGPVQAVVEAVRRECGDNKQGNQVVFIGDTSKWDER